MLTLFRKEQPVGYVFLFIYCLILRMAVFFSVSNWSPMSSGQLSELIYSNISYNSFFAELLGTLLLYFQAVLLVSMCNSNNIIKDNTFFPGLFFITLSCIFPEFNSFSPFLIANTFLIAALYSVLNSYKNQFKSGSVFNAGFLVAIATLFYFSYIIFFVCCFVGFLRLRSFKFIERIQYLIGFVIPFFLVGTYFYWIDQLNEFLFSFRLNIASFSFLTNNELLVWIKLGILGVILLFVLGSYNSYTFKNSIHGIRKINLLFWFLILPIFTIFFQANIRFENIQIFFVPLGILLGLSMYSIRNYLVAEIIHLVLISISFLFQYIL